MFAVGRVEDTISCRSGVWKAPNSFFRMCFIRVIMSFITRIEEQQVRLTKKEIITNLIEDARRFRFCGPSDDPDKQTAVTTGYRYLVIQFKRLAGPLLPEAVASQLQAIDVEIDNLYSAFEAKAELDALLPDIEATLERLGDEAGSPADAGEMTLIADSRLAELRALAPTDFDFKKLIRLCEEMNTAYRGKCFFATAMLTRGLLDHVPPLFGKNIFSEVVNNYGGGGKSFKDAMLYLENAARKVADAHLHMPIRKRETLPTAQQVHFASQLDVLLSEIVRIAQ